MRKVSIIVDVLALIVFIIAAFLKVKLDAWISLAWVLIALDQDIESSKHEDKTSKEDM